MVGWRELSLTPFRGFTLVEMLAVIALIAIGAAVTAVALHGRARGQLGVAAQDIAAGLRDTRTRAMATAAPQWFSVDLRTRSWTAPGHATRDVPAGAGLRVTSAAEDVAQPGIARIRYFPDGTSSGGHIELVLGRRVARIDVDWLTGAVTVATGGAQAERTSSSGPGQATGN